MSTFNPRVFDTFPVLETKRLMLRDIRLDDARQIFEMRSNSRVNEFIARPTMVSETDANDLVTRTIKAYKQKLAIGWAGVLKDGNGIIGTCGFNSIEAHNMHAEIGGEMATEYWGKFLAQEAVHAIIAFGINEMNLQTIEAKVSPLNRSAIYVMEKMGFVKEAHYKNRIYFEGAFKDMAVYTLHASEYKNSNQRFQ